MDHFTAQYNTPSFITPVKKGMSQRRKYLIGGAIVGILIAAAIALYGKYHKKPTPIINGMQNLMNLEAGSEAVTASPEELGKELLQLEQSTQSPSPTPSKSTPPKKATVPPTPPSQTQATSNTDAQLQTLNSLGSQ